jgi:hypothetical protein
MRTMSCPLFSVPKKLPTFVHPPLKRITRQRDHNALRPDAAVTPITPVSALFLGASVVNFGNTKSACSSAEAEELCSRAEPDDQQRQREATYRPQDDGNEAVRSFMAPLEQLSSAGKTVCVINSRHV